MSRSTALAPLADHIVSRTLPRSYQSREHLDVVLIERNFARLKYSSRAMDILCGMVERRLVERDGAAYAEGGAT